MTYICHNSIVGILQRCVNSAEERLNLFSLFLQVSHFSSCTWYPLFSGSLYSGSGEEFCYTVPLYLFSYIFSKVTLLPQEAHAHVYLFSVAVYKYSHCWGRSSDLRLFRTYQVLASPFPQTKPYSVKRDACSRENCIICGMQRKSASICPTSSYFLIFILL